MESLFLSRCGVKYLPTAFLASALLTMVLLFIYSLFVDKVRNDLCFVLILSMTLAVTLSVRFLFPSPWTQAALLFCIFYALAALFVNHFWIYASDFFDMMQSKRLYPLLAGGLSTGGLFGGLATAFLASPLGTENLVFLWLVAVAFSIFWICVKGYPLRSPTLAYKAEKDEGSLRSLLSMPLFLRRSPLARGMILSTILMVSAVFISQYLFSDVFTRRWPGADDLTRFFGIFQIFSNLIEIGISTVITPRVVSLLGVGASNLLFPLTTLLGIGAFLFSFSFPTALLARFNKDSLDPSISSPVRAMFFNAFPRRLQGRLRALIEGVVYYSAIIMAGAGLAVLQQGSTNQAVLLGAGFSLLYLITNVHLFFEYRKALASGLKEGTLDLGDNPLERAKLPAETLESLIMELAPLEDESSLCVFGSALKLLDRKRRGLLYGPLLERGGERAKIMILEAIARDESWDQAPGIRRLASEGGRPLRCAALGVLAAVGDGETLARGLEDQDPGVRVEAASLVLSRPGLGHGVRAREVIDDALESGSEESRACALSALGRVVSPESVRILLEQYALQGGSARNAALDSLGSLCAAMSLEPDLRAQVEAAVTKAMDEADDAARSIALNAAIRMNIPGLPPACFSRLDDPSPAVRNFAREFLVLRESQFIELASRNVQSLYGMKLEGVLSILGRIGTSPCRDILYRFMESRVAQCAEAMQGLVLLEGNGRTERGEIYAEVLRDFVSRTTQHLLSALEGAEEPGLVRAVRLGLFSWEDHRKAHALETLSGMGRRSVTSLLVPLLEDMSWEERLKAFRSIQGIQLKNIDDLAESHAASSDLLLRTGALLYRGALPNLDEEVLKMKNLILLRRVPLFEKMALEDLLAVSASLQESLYYGGEVIFREKDPGDEMFIIVEGTVRIFKNHGRPGALELAVLGSNSYFGEMALLSEEPRSATAVASEDTKLLSLRGESLREIIVQRPEIAFQLIKVLIGRLLRSEERTLR